MAVLEAAFATVRQGGPSAVLLGGEAGVGKSRLVGEFGQIAAAAGACVLTGPCLELGTDGLPFAPFTAILRELVHEFGADAVASMLPGRTTRGLVRLLPELGEPDAGGDPGEARARLFEDMLTALRPAVTANVLLVRADGCAFRHELISEAVHSDLLPGEHGRLHSRFADAIDANPSLVPPGRAAIELAHHWYLAHDTARALIGAWQAAAQAERAVAPAERLSLLARVLELWEQVPDAAERIGADHARVVEEATNAAHDAGEYERGIALATSALKELDPATEPVRVAMLLQARGHFKMNLGRAEFTEDYTAALRIVPADAPAARIPILLSAAHCVPEASVERAYAEEALALARQIGDEANEANALLTLALFHAGAGQQSGTGDDPLKPIAQARAMAERAGALGLLVKAAINESHLLEGAGEHELAVEAARRGTANSDAQYLARASRSLLAVNEVEPLLALLLDAAELIGAGAGVAAYCPASGTGASFRR